MVFIYGHAPLLTCLKPGPVRLKEQKGNENVYYFSVGYPLEVQPYIVTILADSVLRAGDMDEAAASEAKAAAEKELATRQVILTVHRQLHGY